MSAVSFLAIGSEILDGRIQDTNSAFMTSRLIEHGIGPRKILVCDDRIPEIVDSLKYLRTFSDIIVVGGGLGPTTDDVTRESIAEFSGKKLIFHENEFELLKQFFEKRQRALSENHKRQAMIPEGAKLIKNHVGTASGFIVELEDGAKIICLPGVPAELMSMFEATVEPLIVSHFKTRSQIKKRVFRIFGLMESEVGSRIESLSLPEGIVASYRANFPEIQVKLKSEGSEEELKEVASEVKAVIGEEFIFSQSLEWGIERVVHDLLLRSAKRVGTAESCTAGMLGMFLTNTPGSSTYYVGGVNSYSSQVKIHVLGVSQKTIQDYGEVSESTAKEMALGIRKLLNSDIGLSITGIAGPSGGTPKKPVGTVWIGLATGSECFGVKMFFPSDRERIRRFSTYFALDVLRRHLSGIPQYEN